MKNLKLKQMVPVRLDGSDEDVMARVSRIYPVADSSRHTVKIKLDLPTDAVAGPGMYARVKIPTAGQGRYPRRRLYQKRQLFSEAVCHQCLLLMVKVWPR